MDVWLSLEQSKVSASMPFMPNLPTHKASMHPQLGWPYLPRHEVRFGEKGHVGLVITWGTCVYQAETVPSSEHVHNPPTRLQLPAQPTLSQF